MTSPTMRPNPDQPRKSNERHSPSTADQPAASVGVWGFRAGPQAARQRRIVALWACFAASVLVPVVGFIAAPVLLLSAWASPRLQLMKVSFAVLMVINAVAKHLHVLGGPVLHPAETLTVHAVTLVAAIIAHSRQKTQSGNGR